MRHQGKTVAYPATARSPPSESLPSEMHHPPKHLQTFVAAGPAASPATPLHCLPSSSLAPLLCLVMSPVPLLCWTRVMTKAALSGHRTYWLPGRGACVNHHSMLRTDSAFLLSIRRCLI